MVSTPLVREMLTVGTSLLSSSSTPGRARGAFAGVVAGRRPFNQVITLLRTMGLLVSLVSVFFSVSPPGKRPLAFPAAVAVPPALNSEHRGPQGLTFSRGAAGRIWPRPQGRPSARALSGR